MLSPDEKRAAKQAYKAVHWLHERMTMLREDPMTSAMGAPVGDFYEEWSRKHCCMLAECLENPHNTPQTATMLLNAMDQYLP